MTTVVAVEVCAPCVPIRVLVADDSVGLRRLVRYTLDEADGIEVVAEASDGAEAVALADAVRPDVVLLDVAMPVMDGLEALSELRRRLPAVRVVMLSGFSEQLVAARAVARGASAYVEKSGDLTRLVAAVRTAADGAAPLRSPVSLPAISLVRPAARTDSTRPARPRQTMSAVTSAVAPPLARSWLPVAAVVMFVGLYLLREHVDEMVRGGAALYVMPMALVAIRYRLTGGLVGSAVASGLFAAYAEPHALPAIEYVPPLAAYCTVGLAIGLYAEHVARLTAARTRDEAALVAANRRLAETTASVRAANEALDANNAELRHFGYVASHDLAEPLRTMSGFARLLAERYPDRLDDTGREYLTHILAGSARMQALIDDLRAYTSTGQQELARTAVPLEDVLVAARTALGAALAEKHAVVHSAGRLPVVTGDRSMLTVLLQNLVSNAVKFNDSPVPTAIVRGRVDGNMAVVEVSDNGIGIPAEQQERVFALFCRLHTAQEYPGTGLGLAICERIVTRHGGAIVLTSAPGIGSTFVITLPVANGGSA